MEAEFGACSTWSPNQWRRSKPDATSTSRHTPTEVGLPVGKSRSSKTPSLLSV